MGFLDALRRALGADAADIQGAPVPPAVVEPGGPIAASGADAGPAAPDGHYDRVQWRKKLKRILDELPASQPEWDGLMYDARAHGFDLDWVTQCQGEEFLLLIRRVVSDRVFTESEHHKLDLARRLIGLTEAEGESLVHAVVADAELFFGKPVREV